MVSLSLSLSLSLKGRRGPNLPLGQQLFGLNPIFFPLSGRQQSEHSNQRQEAASGGEGAKQTLDSCARCAPEPSLAGHQAHFRSVAAAAAASKLRLIDLVGWLAGRWNYCKPGAASRAGASSAARHAHENMPVVGAPASGLPWGRRSEAGARAAESKQQVSDWVGGAQTERERERELREGRSQAIRLPASQPASQLILAPPKQPSELWRLIARPARSCFI